MFTYFLTFTNMKKVLFTFIGIGLVHLGAAQSKYSEKDFANKPIWISMMDEEHVNYFIALKAFDTYWANHKKPEGESDMDVQQTEKNKKRFSKREVREAREEAKMRMQIKKFNWWKNKMEPFVQDDGTIVLPAERLKLYQNNN